MSEIDLDFSDDSIALDRYLYAPDEAFESFPEYRVNFLENRYKDNFNVLNLAAPNPDLLKPADPARIAQWQKVASIASKPLMAYTMQNRVKWCIVAVACPAWAKAAFRNCLKKKPCKTLEEHLPGDPN